MTQAQRNAPCPCGSGKKYKKCCMNATKRSRLAVRIPVRNKNVYIALIAIFFYQARWPTPYLAGSFRLL